MKDFHKRHKLEIARRIAQSNSEFAAELAALTDSVYAQKSTRTALENRDNISDMVDNFKKMADMFDTVYEEVREEIVNLYRNCKVTKKVTAQAHGLFDTLTRFRVEFDLLRFAAKFISDIHESGLPDSAKPELVHKVILMSKVYENAVDLRYAVQTMPKNNIH